MNLLYMLMARTATAEATERFFLNLSNFTGGGSITDAQGICTIDQVGVLNPVINVNRSSGVAPLSVVFDAINTQVLPSLTTDTFHEVRYGWDFGDTAGVYWQYGTNPGAASKNLAYGPVAAHCFETPGTKTVTLWAYVLTAGGQLHTKSTTYTITVSDPDVVFAGANTICVANGTLPVAGVDGVPAGATCYNQPSWAAVMALAGSGKRVLLKHDDVWTSAVAAPVPTGTTCIIGMYGTGAKPKFATSSNVRGVYLTGGCNDYRVMDLRFEYTETGSTLAENIDKMPVYVTNNSPYATILRVEAYGFYGSIWIQSSDDGMVVDCNCEQTFLNYGNMNAFYYISNRIALLGNRFERSYSTHTVRISGTSKCVVSNNYMGNAGPTRTVFTLRGWEALTPVTQYSVVSDNVMIGGTVAGYALYVGPVGTVLEDAIEDVIYERNYLTSQSPAYTAVLAAQRGMTFRSNIVVSQHQCGVCIVGDGAAVSPPPIDTSIYGNTFYKDSVAITPNYSTFVLSGTVVSGVKFGNNLSYAPNCTHNADGGGSQASMIHLTLGATVGNYSMIGVDSNDTQLNTVRPWAATTPTAYADYTPTGYALGSGTALPTSSDFFNELITDPRDMGAIQA